MAPMTERGGGAPSGEGAGTGGQSGTGDRRGAVGGLPGVRRFYDSLAPDYDLMTSFDERFARERPWFEAIAARFGIRSALDAGCGTGFHAILLSRMGVAAAGVDASPAMVERARENARRLGARVDFLVGEFSELPSIAFAGPGVPGPGEPFDALFCLGNSLPHLLTAEALAGALSGFRAVLRPGGVLVVQLLNYERILRERKEVLGSREAGGTTFERRYAYRGEEILFTVERRSGRSDPSKAEDTIRLRPMRIAELGPALEAAGFASIEQFGGLALTPFDPPTSPDLVLAARLPG